MMRDGSFFVFFIYPFLLYVTICSRRMSILNNYLAKNGEKSRITILRRQSIMHHIFLIPLQSSPQACLGKRIVLETVRVSPTARSSTLSQTYTNPSPWVTIYVMRFGLAGISARCFYRWDKLGDDDVAKLDNKSSCKGRV